MKILRVTMPDGVYEIPAQVIADHAASFYAQQTGPDVRRDAAWWLRDDYSLMDWAANDMNWADVQGRAVKAKGQAPVNHEAHWANAEMVVVEKAP